MKYLGFLLFSVVSIYSYAENLLQNSGFENGSTHWLELNSAGSIVEGIGRNGSACLRISRQSPEEPRPVIKQDVKLTPGRRYKISGWIKCDGELRSYDKDLAKPLIALECWRNGNYGGWVATWSGDLMPQEWSYYEVEYTAGDPANYQIILLGASVTTCGTWYYDDISIEQLPGEWSLGQTWPMHGKVNPSGGEVCFHSFFGDIPAEFQRIQMTLRQHDSEITNWDFVMTAPFSVTLQFPPLSEGNYELSASLYDDRTNEKLASQVLPITVTVHNPSVNINFDRTVIAENSKFLPIGVFAPSISRQAVEEMQYAGFNSVLTYNTIWCSIDDQSGGNLAALRKAMDYCAESNFKVVLSLGMFNPMRDNITSWDGVEGNYNIIAHLVSSLSDHPALLAWYLADEPTLQYLPWCQNTYNIVRENDINHPVLTVFNTIGNLPKFTPCSDLFGFDEYPITQASSLGNAVAAGERMHAYNVPYWWVGQIMSWGSYKPPQEYRYPTEEEMLAQNLLAFINNAKGIINYSMYDVTEPGEEYLRNLRLGEFRRVNMTCQSLADFILCDAEVPEYSVEVQEGTLKHRLFSNGAGEYRLLLVSPFVGDTQAVITLPEGLEFAGSLRYAVTEETDGTLTFTGKDVACDIVALFATE